MISEGKEVLSRVPYSSQGPLTYKLQDKSSVPTTTPVASPNPNTVVNGGGKTTATLPCGKRGEGH